MTFCSYVFYSDQFLSRPARIAFGGRLELAPSVKELEEVRRGRFSLPTLVRGGIFEPNNSVVNCVRLVIDCHSRWHGSWMHSTGWDCYTLHSTIHYWWNNGGLSLIIVLMGPPPQCSKYI